MRPRVRASQPVHVVLRAIAAIGSLRSHAVYKAIHEASYAALKHEGFHIVHFRVQRSHIHLIVEAKDRDALSRMMQAFSISAAKHINALVSERRGKRCKGTVFPDRYHATILRTPRQVRNCVAYVLNNWRHHREDKVPAHAAWKYDPYSSALAFDGWREDAERVECDFEGPLVWFPKTWLLRVGWRRHGLVSLFEVPGGGAE